LVAEYLKIIRNHTTLKIVIACEYSGRTREAFRARGHDVTSVDLLPSEDNSPHHVVGDAFDVIESIKPDLVVAHPPCTYLANRGVHLLWVRGGRRDRNEARWADMKLGAAFFARFLNLPVPRIAVENPVMHCHARAEILKCLEPNVEMNTFYVQPWWFGDEAFKATGFTTKGLPRIPKPPTALIPPKTGTREHQEWTARIANLPPSPDRWKIRSRTFPGIANALAENWG
jgi:hypothetical protein